MSRLLFLLCCFGAVTACSKASAPAPPSVPPSVETINGSERLGWEQRAADAVELATIAYVVYVDGARTPLTGVNCAATASASGFACSAPLPRLPAGAHALQLASFVNDGGVLESERSATLQVTVTAAVTKASPTAQSFDAATSTTTGGVRLRAAMVADGLDQPTDLAFAPDGRLFIAERAGRVRVVQFDGGTRLLAEPALSLADTHAAGGTLLAVAVDPDFDRTHFVFAIYVSPDRSGEATFNLARFREASNTLGDAAVLLDNVRASASPAAALRFGRDKKLYVAFDDGDDPSAAGDAASFNGTTLRLNTDGTTPDDQPRMTPVFAAGHPAPRGFDWDLRWGRPSAARATVAIPYAGARFPAFVGRLIVTTPEGTVAVQTAAGAGETLAPDRIGGVTTVAVAPDGAIYFATATAVGRLVADTP